MRISDWSSDVCSSDLPIPESAPARPINPYGSSKLVTEWMLRDLALAGDLRYVALRYFNVAGADPQGRSGQLGPVATHLIKIASQVVAGRREAIYIFCHAYDTPHGVRNRVVEGTREAVGVERGDDRVVKKKKKKSN